VADNPDYVLGHSDFELGRLARQERLIGQVTREYLLAAGIEPGMRVLDVGSGTGAVAFIAAELVGPTGEVVGSDLAATAVEAARAGATERSLNNVSFREGNLAEMSFARQFDAVVGRYVLLFQSNAAEMLRELGGAVRPGGVIVFHEPDWSFVRSDPAAPVYDQCQQWVVDVFERVGTSTNMAGKLRRAFVDAGLGPPTMRMRAVIGDAETAGEWLRRCRACNCLGASDGTARRGQPRRNRLRHTCRSLARERRFEQQHGNRARRNRCRGSALNIGESAAHCGLAQPGEYPARRHTDMQPARRTRRATTAPSIVAAGTVRGRERVVCIAQGWKQSRAINNSLRSPGSLEYLLPRPSVEEIIIMLLKGLRGECRHGIKGPASQAAGARYVRPLRPCP
jgi:ubiquinone/menaquinone biosynthesis C-methylase UbiE